MLFYFVFDVIGCPEIWLLLYCLTIYPVVIRIHLIVRKCKNWTHRKFIVIGYSFNVIFYIASNNTLAPLLKRIQGFTTHWYGPVCYGVPTHRRHIKQPIPTYINAISLWFIKYLYFTFTIIRSSTFTIGD